MDEPNSSGLDVIEIIARKALLWMLTACAKQFASCWSACPQLSGLVVPEQTYGWRTIYACPNNWPWLAESSTILLKVWLDALWFSSHVKDWLEVTFALLGLKETIIYWNEFRIGTVSLGGVLISILLDQKVSQELWDSTLLSQVQTYTCDTEAGYLSLN